MYSRLPGRMATLFIYEIVFKKIFSKFKQIKIFFKAFIFSDNLLQVNIFYLMLSKISNESTVISKLKYIKNQ